MASKFLILLSPAKKLLDNPISKATCTEPLFSKQITTLIKELKQHSVEDLEELMHLSTKLAQLNYDRFQQFNPKKFDESNASQAIFTFNGHAYETLNAKELDNKAFTYLQNHLFILSGLYGFLRPTDWMQPYRLEMKTQLETDGCVNLYEFWTETLTNAINNYIEREGFTHILNCASIEYAGAVDFSALKAPTITFKFQQRKDDKYKSIGIYSKKARGLMVRYLSETQAKSLQTIEDFNLDGYKYDFEDSSSDVYVFKKQL